jgi:hypothetical protein
MPFHHDSHIRPTADSINRFATQLLAAKPGMNPLDAVRLAMESAEREADAAGRADERPSGLAGDTQRPLPGWGSRD